MPAHRALAIGNFDGVHRGHQALIDCTVRTARERGWVPTVVTFEPSPAAWFARERGAAAPIRLQRLRDKLSCLWSLGIEHIHAIRFDNTIAQMTPDAFCDTVLREALGVRWLIVGEDFRYGHKRSGDIASLRRWAAQFNVECQVLPAVGAPKARFSSSLVRDALAKGDCALAAAVLGRPYRISGKVIHGQKLGRTLGFPTLNIALWSPLPLSGVFAVRVHGIEVTGREPLPGAASVGVRPTVADGGRPLLEVHLLDFSGDLYGRRVVVEFVEFLRPEIRFHSIAAMLDAMRSDVARAREVLAGRQAAIAEFA